MQQQSSPTAPGPRPRSSRATSSPVHAVRQAGASSLADEGPPEVVRSLQTTALAASRSTTTPCPSARGIDDFNEEVEHDRRTATAIRRVRVAAAPQFGRLQWLLFIAGTRRLGSTRTATTHASSSARRIRSAMIFKSFPFPCPLAETAKLLPAGFSSIRLPIPCEATRLDSDYAIYALSSPLDLAHPVPPTRGSYGGSGRVDAVRVVLCGVGRYTFARPTLTRLDPRAFRTHTVAPAAYQGSWMPSSEAYCAGQDLVENTPSTAPTRPARLSLSPEPLSDDDDSTPPYYTSAPSPHHTSLASQILAYTSRTQTSSESPQRSAPHLLVRPVSLCRPTTAYCTSGPPPSPSLHLTRLARRISPHPTAPTGPTRLPFTAHAHLSDDSAAPTIHSISAPHSYRITRAHPTSHTGITGHRVSHIAPIAHKAPHLTSLA
ncbi:hypothetical protein B0H12DRAFT_1328459 [Mycena haematopus]|nr:hypothetical protein B0H12DRAFT_1328459 [Mycena haematopus]